MRLLSEQFSRKALNARRAHYHYDENDSCLENRLIEPGAGAVPMTLSSPVERGQVIHGRKRVSVLFADRAPHDLHRLDQQPFGRLWRLSAPGVMIHAAEGSRTGRAGGRSRVRCGPS